MAGRAEHHGIALGPAVKGMRRRIGVVVGLDFDDSSADAVNQERRTDQFGRDRVYAPGKECRRQLLRFLHDPFVQRSCQQQKLRFSM